MAQTTFIILTGTGINLNLIHASTFFSGSLEANLIVFKHILFIPFHCSNTLSSSQSISGHNLISLAWDFKKWHCIIERIRLQPLTPAKQELFLLVVLCAGRVAPLPLSHGLAHAAAFGRRGGCTGKDPRPQSCLAVCAGCWRRCPSRPSCASSSRGLAALHCGFKVMFQLTKTEASRSLRT